MLFQSSSGEIAALGSTLRGMGVQNEIAATGIKNLMITLTSGSKATKGQKEAFHQLGFSSKQVAGSMQKDSQKTITTILKSIKRLDKVHQPEVLNALFGKEVVPSIAPLLQNMDELQKQFQLVGDKSKYAGSMQKEFESRSSTTSNSLVLLKNRFNRMAITIGSSVLPLLNELVVSAYPYIDQIATLIDDHPKLTKGIIVVGGALLALKVIALGSGFAWTTVNGYWLSAVKMLTKLDTALIKTGVNWRMLNLSLVASPLGLLITGIVIAVAALSLVIYKNWDIIKKFISGAITPLWEGIKPVREAFSKLGDLVVRLGKDLGLTGENVNKIKGFFKNLFNPIDHSKESLDSAKKSGEEFGKSMSKAINDVSEPLIKFVDSLKWLDDNMSGIMNKAQTFGHEEIKSAWNSTMSWFKGNQATPKNAPTGTGWVPAFGQLPPPTPTMAIGKGGNQYTDNSTTTIQATQLPGESGADFARRVVEEQRKAKQQQSQSYMPDNMAIP